MHGKKPARSRLGTAAAAALLATAVAYVGLVDPHRPGSVFPPCPFRLLTGWNCPACGGLRMAHDLLHANVGAAVMDNVFLLAGIPALVSWILLRRMGERDVLPMAASVVIVVTTLAWTVVRNLPGFPLTPTPVSG